MKNTKQFDRKVKENLLLKCNEVNISDSMFQKIRANIFEEEERMNKMKNKFRIKNLKKVALVGGLCIASITVVAATQVKSWIGHSKPYEKVLDKETMEKDLGFIPKYVEVLDGGFEMKSTHITEGTLQDEEGKQVQKTKGLGFFYERNNTKEGQYLALNAEKIDKNFLTQEPVNAKTEYKGIEVSYQKTQYKFVPEDYKLTEQDKKDEAEGKLVISVGSDKVEYSEIKSVSWYEEGISYVLQAGNYEFTQDEMLEMAKSIINQK